MIRRHLLALGAAALLLPATGASAAERLFYEPGMAEAAMAEGQVILLDFFAPWCTTCRAQERVLDALRAENPDYDRVITFITVDWDAYGDGELSRALEVPRRSTLIALAGETELGRIVAGTSEEEIRALLDAAVAAGEGAAASG